MTLFSHLRVILLQFDQAALDPLYRPQAIPAGANYHHALLDVIGVHGSLLKSARSEQFDILSCRCHASSIRVTPAEGGRLNLVAASGLFIAATRQGEKTCLWHVACTIHWFFFPRPQ
jgi:hypothetical protein